MARVMAGDVRTLFAENGIELPASAGTNVAIPCFSNADAHRNGDRSPSCSVNVENGAWNCHACGACGGAYDALLALGRSPGDAMALLRSHGLAEENGNGHGPAAKPTPVKSRWDGQRA